MSETKFTPGKWHSEKHGNQMLIVSEDSSRPELRTCVCQIDPSTEAEANARLIASAPELLEVLERIQNNAAGRKWNSESNDPADMEAFTAIEQACKQALAKAKGQP